MTSGDVLAIIVAICAIWLTVFGCIALYHLAGTLRNANRMLTSARHKVDAFDGLLRAISDRFDHSGKLLGGLVEHVVTLVGQVASAGRGKTRRKRSG